MPQRFAIYYAPATTEGLWDRASVWLGRDPGSGHLHDGAVAGIDRTRLLNLTQSAGRYGFHATIKPPFALADGQSPAGLDAALAELCRSLSPVNLGPLTIGDLAGFLALVPQRQDNPQLLDLAAHVVEALEPFRAPLSLRDRAARAAHGLTARQEELLDAYGYPYVFDEFQFHMTLTDRLGDEDRRDLLAAAQTWFGPVLGQDVVLDRLVIYHEAENRLPFRRLAEFKLGA